MGEKTSIMKLIKANIRQYTMFIALLVLMVIFTISTGGTFLMARNLSNLFLQTSHIAILACGVVLVIVAGHIDLSIGAVVGFTGAIAAQLMVKFGMHPVIAIIITLLVGALIGVWHGYWIAYKEVPAFIVTLASMMAFQGALLWVTGGATITPNDGFFKAISQNYLPNFPGMPAEGFHVTTMIFGLVAIIAYIIMEFKTRADRKRYGFNVISMNLQILKVVLISVGIGAFFGILTFYRGMHLVLVIVLIIAVIFAIITQKTKFGRYVYAIGGNKEAARLSGINIKKMNMWIFVSMGVLSALGGIVYTSRLNAATAGAGSGMELEVIAAAIIGGTSTLGGEGTIMGAIIGALVMATLNNGMSLMNWQPDIQFVTKGLILLFAVWVDISSRKARK